MAKTPIRSGKANELLGWTFDEVSAGVYKVTGKDSLGRSIEKIGVDVDLVLADCKRDAILLRGQPGSLCYKVHFLLTE